MIEAIREQIATIPWSQKTEQSISDFPNPLYNIRVHLSTRLNRPFFARPTLQVARELLGMHLVRQEEDHCIAGIVIETEAYIGEEDRGSHAHIGLTNRNRVMFGPPGCAYVYFTYGMHWMLNVVTETEGFPAAVLIRAVHPIEGLEVIAKRRNGQPSQHWTDGPAKLCQAFNIDGRYNGIDLCAPKAALFFKTGEPIPASCVSTEQRVGLNNVPEPWRSLPWRFLARMNKHHLSAIRKSDSVRLK